MLLKSKNKIKILLLKRQEQNLLFYSEAFLEHSQTSMMELFWEYI